MSNDPVQPGTGADDLLGRWFAHHERAEDKSPAAREPASPDDGGTSDAPRHVPLAARPSEAAAPRLTRPSASAVLAELRAAPAS
ncbi:hypothetical protein, partial [Nocardioides sp.]|uniref:hypothetical protein n=1 Tax=Nocardioides sp. TaxID=35761 RepID=UPI001A21DA98